jgi:hypothetical protein
MVFTAQAAVLFGECHARAELAHLAAATMTA